MRYYILPFSFFLNIILGALLIYKSLWVNPGFSSNPNSFIDQIISQKVEEVVITRKPVSLKTDKSTRYSLLIEESLRNKPVAIRIDYPDSFPGASIAYWSLDEASLQWNWQPTFFPGNIETNDANCTYITFGGETIIGETMVWCSLINIIYWWRDHIDNTLSIIPTSEMESNLTITAQLL